MSENMNQNGQQQPTTLTPEANGGQGGERTFTQEEVNRIVADRLARDMAKFKASVEKLVKAFPALIGAQRPTFEGWKPGESTHKGGSGSDPIAAAFKPK